MKHTNDIIRMAREAGWHDELLSVSFTMPLLERLVTIVEDAQAKRMHEEGMVTVGHMRQQIAAEREVLEAELLKLKRGVASTSEYIQGRWDLIGEFQDIIRARGQA